MTEPDEFSMEDDVAVIPVDAERGLALVLGAEVIDAESWQMPRRLISDAIMVGGLMGGGRQPRPSSSRARSSGWPHRPWRA